MNLTELLDRLLGRPDPYVKAFIRELKDAAGSVDVTPPAAQSIFRSLDEARDT